MGSDSEDSDAAETVFSVEAVEPVFDVEPSPTGALFGGVRGPAACMAAHQTAFIPSGSQVIILRCMCVGRSLGPGCPGSLATSDSGALVHMLSALTVWSQGTVACQLAASLSHCLPDGRHKHVLP